MKYFKFIQLHMLGLLLCVNAFGQAGVNTAAPQQELHVSGSPSTSTAIGTTGKFMVTPTLRIEGLNQTNNSAHPAAPAVSTQPVYATASGDLVIGNRVQLIKQTLPGADALAQAVLSVPSGVAGTSAVVYTKSFTLNQPSMVYFMANISGEFLGSTGAVLATGGSKMSGIEFSFSAAPATSGLPTSTCFAAAQYSYMQDATSGAAGFHGSTNVPNGIFIFNLGKMLRLPVGTYTCNIIVCGSAGTGSAFRLIYGVGPNDHINITAVSL